MGAEAGRSPSNGRQKRPLKVTDRHCVRLTVVVEFPELEYYNSGTILLSTFFDEREGE